MGVLLAHAFQVASVLWRVCEEEGLHVAPAFLDRIAAASNRNLRRAVLMLESAKTRECGLRRPSCGSSHAAVRCRAARSACNPDSPVQTTDWERFIAGVADDMINEQTPQRCAAREAGPSRRGTTGAQTPTGCSSCAAKCTSYSLTASRRT